MVGDQCGMETIGISEFKPNYYDFDGAIFDISYFVQCPKGMTAIEETDFICKNLKNRYFDLNS